ncbi:Uncharacterised protein [Mycobacterium tuberculosis]|nr:Uncharacterised protein [Mycobacterium tuberculosis]
MASSNGGLVARISSGVMPCSSNHSTSFARSARAVPPRSPNRSSMFASSASRTWSVTSQR